MINYNNSDERTCRRCSAENINYDERDTRNGDEHGILHQYSCEESVTGRIKSSLRVNKNMLDQPWIYEKKTVDGISGVIL